MIRNAHPEDISQLIAIQQTIENEGAILGYQADSESHWAVRNLD